MTLLTKRAAIVTLTVAAVLDVMTTIVGIEYAGLSEYNPLVRPLMDAVGYAGLLIPTALLFIIALGGAWVIQHRSSEYGKVGGVAAIYCCASVKLLAASWNSVLIASVSL